jgi:hypothetical protein
MSFEKFVHILSENSLFFSRADMFDDPFEGFKPEPIKTLEKEGANKVKNDPEIETMEIFDGDTQEKFLENWRRYIICSCWYQNENQSMAMWKNYHMLNSGIAIKTTVENLENSLSDEHDVFIGEIKYSDDNNYELHYMLDALTPRPSSWPEFLKKKIYFPYFLKNAAYEHENEIRLIIDSVPAAINYLNSNSPAESTPADLLNLINNGFPDIWENGLSLKIDVEKLIGETGEVLISPFTPDWITETVKSVVCQYGFNFEVQRSKLLDKPT